MWRKDTWSCQAKGTEKKTVPQENAEFSSTDKYPISVMIVMRRLISVGFKGCVWVKEPLLKKQINWKD